MKKIRTNPTRGDVYDCVFGNYEPLDPASPQGPFSKSNMDRRIPNEIRKRRPVVIVGERHKQYLVVPISSSEDRHKKPHRTGEAVKLHVRLVGDEVPETDCYTPGTVRWAKTDLLQSVDEERLREFRCVDGQHRIGKVAPEALLAIQHGVMRAIGLTATVEALNAKVAAELDGSSAAAQAGADHKA